MTAPHLPPSQVRQATPQSHPFDFRTFVTRGDWLRSSAMKAFGGLLTVFPLLALRVSAATNDIESAVLRFPRVSALQFRPDIAVECANTLIMAGRDAACDQLRKLANTNREAVQDQEQMGQGMCFLCRLVFLTRNQEEPLRAPRLGAMKGLPYESMRAEDWPFLPFAITNGVPLSMTLGYALAGRPEPAGDYLTYCVSNGVFRTNTFPPSSTTSASNTLTQILTSPAWRALKWEDSGLGWSYSLDEGYAREMLWQQVENMTNQTGSARSR
jgi:hypothetical protein